MKKLLSISTLGLAVAALTLLNGCSKLNQSSTTSVPASKLFKDTVSLNEALVGLYSTLEVQEYYGAFYPMLADLNSDNGISGGYNNTSLDEFGAYSVTSSNVFVQNMYVALYYTIATANAILAGENGITDTSAETLQLLASVKGQALAIRALAHFDLLRAFGYHWDLTSPYGIPVVTTVQTASDIVARSTVADTYTAILSDLNQSATLLSGDAARNANYINPAIVNALLARVYLYMKDYTDAANYATLVIDDGSFSLLDQNNFPSIYTQKLSKESVFELPFNQQNQSEYNISTYARPDAASTEVFFIASQDLQNFLLSRPADLRINLLDYSSPNFYPNGRTLKYSSDISQKDNSAYVIRIAEMYMIRAEALGRSGGLGDLNLVRVNRGLAALGPSDVPDDATYAQAVSDEDRAEFNFEGHRYFDLARTGQVADVLGVPATNSVFPIPLAQINATHGIVVQNPGY
ncbi:MAG: RagB/SusD family nutrient uptake outer membrane protein [Puia sp.]|nr:RagB/SusD family nutrient uptake outer membrane protein [Puia sp.]